MDDTCGWLQDFLPVFAAGNFGSKLVDTTIASPSTAKNCMAVGTIPAPVLRSLLLSACPRTPSQGLPLGLYKFKLLHDERMASQLE